MPRHRFSRLSRTLLFAWLHRGKTDSHRHKWRFALCLGAINGVSDFQSATNPAKPRELSIKVRTGADQNKEMRACAVGLVAAGHRNYAADMLHIVRLVGEFASHPGRQCDSP